MNDGNEPNRGGNTSGHAGKTSASSRVITLTDERIDSRDLFIAGRQITIAHGGEVYSLRLTAQNKLILTK
jgi:hemin uptake protein HemP